MNTLILPPQEGLLPPRSVGLGDLLVLVGQEGKWKAVFPGELVVGRGGIGADTQHDRAFLDERAIVVAKRAGLLGAAGGVVPGIEIQYDVFALEIGQRHFAPAVGIDGKGRRGVPLFKFQLYLFSHKRMRLIVDRKSTRLNSSHLGISYAVFCL